MRNYKIGIIIKGVRNLLKIRHRLSITILMLVISATVRINAQEVIPATGANISGAKGSISYTVGQLVYTTNAGSIGSVTQGIQQSFEIKIVNGIKDTEGINLSVSAYPNPTTDYLILKVSEYPLSVAKFQLYDLNGKLLESKKIENNETSIFMGNLLPATYFLKIINGNTEIKTFKIRKN